MLSKHKRNGDIEYAPVYFNSVTKTVINSDEYDLHKSYQEIFCRVDNWINEGSGWVIESVEAQCLNISIYSPLIGNTYIELPDKLKTPVKGLINIKNNYNKCFLWCNIRHLNLVKRHPEEIKKKIKTWLMILIMKELDFLFQKRIIAELKDKTIFVLMRSVLKIIRQFLYQIKV